MSRVDNDVDWGGGGQVYYVLCIGYCIQAPPSYGLQEAGGGGYWVEGEVDAGWNNSVQFCAILCLP